MDDILEYLRLDRRIILKWILEKVIERYGNESTFTG
jgi:hypothetical protein